MTDRERADKALQQIEWAVGVLAKLERQLERLPDRDICTLGTVRCLRHALDDTNPIIQSIRRVG